MELGIILTTAFMVGLSGAMMPGPLLTVTIGESARRGFIAGPLIVCGHGILEGVLVIALALGLATFLLVSVIVKVIAVGGGLYLLYLGWGVFKDARAGKLKMPFLDGGNTGGSWAVNNLPEPGKEKAVGSLAGFCSSPGGKWNCSKQLKGMHPVLAGILISLSNPYWSLWWGTVGLSYITISLKFGALGLASFFTGHLLSDLAWYSFVAGMVAGGRRLLKPEVYQVVLAICGLFLIGLGGYFIFWGASS